MNSFRVIDTRFRILKGGKIGLAMSIALIGGMLTLGSTKAVATNYFEGIDVTLGTSTNSSGNGITVQTATNGGTTSDSRALTSSDDVIFKPTSWADSSYIAPGYDSDYDGNGNAAFILNRTITNNLQLNLTFLDGANANNISKSGTSIYTADGALFKYDVVSIPQEDLTLTSSTAYTANLIFQGNTTVSGNTDIDNGNIQIAGNDVTFHGSIEAGSIDIKSSGLANLNTISGATTSDIVFSGNGTANLYGNLTGNVTTTVNNQGILTTTGSTQTITGNIGTSILGTTLGLSTLNIGSNTDATNYSTTTIIGDVYANSTVLNNNSLTNSSELILASGKNITSSISTADANMGILTLAGGAQTVTGQVGTDTYRLAQVNSGADGATSTFVNDVYAVDVTNTGTGTTTFQNDVKATNVNVNDGTTTFQDNLTATTTTITTGTGNFNTVSGATSSDIVFTDTGTANLYGNLTGNVTTDDDNQGTLTIIGSSSGKAQTINGNIGTSSSLDLATLNIGDTGNYTVTTINGNVYANSTVLNNVTTNSSELILASGKSITSTITTANDGKGILTLVGGTQTVTGAVGTSGAKLANVNAGANSSTSTFSNDVYATNLDVEGTGTVNLNGNFTGTNLRYNEDGIVNLADGKNITSAIISDAPNQGTLNLAGTSTVSGTVGTLANNLKEINAGATGEIATFSNDVYATNLDVEGTGTVNLNGNFTGTNLRYNEDGIVNLADGKNITSAIISDAPNQGTLNLAGTSTVSGTVGTLANNLKEINAGATGEIATFSNDVFATTTNISSGEIKFEEDLTSDIIALTSNNGVVTFVGALSGNTQNVTGNIGSSGNLINTLNIGENGTNKYSTTIIDGNIYATNTVLNNGVSNNSTLELTDGFNINSTITTSNDSQGVLTFLGDSIATGTIGTSTEKLAQINAGADAKIVTFNSSINSDDLNITGDGEIVLADNANINAPITTTTDNEGTLTFNGTSTVSGDLGTSTEKLKEINAGVTGETVTFEDDVYATNTNIASGVVNFNTVSGTTNSNIVFTGNGTANLNEGITGDINFTGNNATVNVSDGKGILGSVQTLASNNTGIINYKGDGTISGNVGSSIYGIKELNINTNNEQNTPEGVLVTSDALGRELYADLVALKNNATLTLADNVNIVNTGSDNIIITVDTNNTGVLTFQGNSNIEGEVGELTRVLNTINAGATGKTVTFDDMVYATNLKYSDDGKVVLNGDNSLNSANEAMIGTVDLDAKSGTLEIGDNVNLTTGTSGIQFANANDAVLEFAGNSTITGVLGGNTAGNSTFERIYAGADNKTVTFKNDVHVKEGDGTTLHVSGTGIVNFEGNLVGDLIYDANGTVNVNNGKSIIVTTVANAVKTTTNNTGILNFKGETTLYGDIGTSTNRLESVTFASEGTVTDSYTQIINKNIYAQNINIGNNSNQTTVNITEDTTFNGNLNLRSNSILNVDDYDVVVADNLDIASNLTLKFKVYTTDISAGQAVENARSGSITASSLTMANDTKINITYEGTWEGAGKYNLINAPSITTDYYGTEKNGLVTDNSIIDSIITKDGTNLTLFADRTGGGSFDAEDLYIVKSEIGNHYSNGASQALAGYANEINRAGALADIVRKMEELEGGLIVTAEKKEEMIKIQKLLAPVANNSTIKSSLVASTLALSTVGSRISDIRVSPNLDFIPYYSGLSSGDYTLDTSFWIKALASRGTQNSVEQYDGYDTNSTGFVIGMDKTLNNGVILGLAAANLNTKIDQADFRAGDDSDTKTMQVMAYGAYEFEDTYVDGLLSYAKHSTDGTRTANSGKVSSSVDADQISAKVEVGHRVYLEDIATLTPFASVEYGTLNQKAYSEKGTAYQNDALKVDSVKLNKGTVGVGAKISTNLSVGNTIIIPEAKLAVYNSFGDTKADVKAQYLGGGNKFVTPTQELNDTTYNVGFSIKTSLSESTSLMLGVDYDRSKDGSFEGYSGNVAFKLSF